MQVITVANPKGGTGKTTTAAFVAHALAEAGLSVLMVDADGENESLMRWADLAEWEVPVIGLPSASIHKRLPALSKGYDAVVIDTPPMDESGVVTAALRAATHVVVPAAPTAMDFDRVGAVQDLLAELAPLRDKPPVIAVLLTQVVASAASGGAYRDLIAESGIAVLHTRIPRLERYAQSFAAPIASAGIYADAVAELLELDPMEDPE